MRGQGEKLNVWVQFHVPSCCPKYTSLGCEESSIFMFVCVFSKDSVTLIEGERVTTSSRITSHRKPSRPLFYTRRTTGASSDRPNPPSVTMTSRPETLECRLLNPREVVEQTSTSLGLFDSRKTDLCVL